MKDKMGALVVIAVLSLIALVVAWVCFTILDSQASGKLRQYSVEGGYASFVISWGLFVAAFYRLDKRSSEVERLREKNRELEQKVIRSASLPTGFAPEVDEQRSLVLGKPKNWIPRGGQIFDFEAPSPKDDNETDGSLMERIARRKEDVRTADVEDLFPARLSVYFDHKVDDEGVESYYDALIASSRHVGGFVSSEGIEVGGPSGLRSLKSIYRVYGEFVETGPPVEGARKSKDGSSRTRSFSEKSPLGLIKFSFV